MEMWIKCTSVRTNQCLGGGAVVTVRRAVGLWLRLVALRLNARIWMATICRLARGL